MEYRQLGRSGLTVSVFGFGVMTFGGSGFYTNMGQTKGDEARRQVDLCLDAGVNLFDTSNSYSFGQSEEVLAKTLGPRRTEVLVATKCFTPTGPGVNELGGSRLHIIAACEASLRRLKTDYIDLYQTHHQDLLTPPDETLRAFDDLVRAGKVRYIGSSNHSGWTKMRALATSDRLGLSRYVSQQIQYSLIARDAENELLPLGVAEGVGAIVWGPLSSGYLSGKFGKSGQPGQARLVTGGSLAAMDTQKGRAVVAAIEDIAASRPGVSPSQVALNWVARRPGVAAILIGARTSDQLADNLAAASWSLTDAEIVLLDDASAVRPPYPYWMQRQHTHGRNPPLALQPAQSTDECPWPG